MSLHQKAETKSTAVAPAADHPPKKRGFTKVEDELLGDPSISPQAKVVLIGLKKFMRRKTTCFPKIEKLADAVGMSKRTVARYLAELRNSGRIEIRRRVGTSSIFTLGGEKRKRTDLPEWLDPDIWEGFCEAQKEMGSPLTKRAAKSIINRLRQLKADGDNPNEVLEESIVRSSRWVFPRAG